MRTHDDDTLGAERRDQSTSLAHAVGAFLLGTGVAEGLADAPFVAGGDMADRLDPAAPNPDADDLLWQRLTLAGLDVAYMQAAEPELFSDLRHSCAKCEHAEACHHDLDEGNGREVEYCRNTASIDALVVERLKGA